MNEQIQKLAEQANLQLIIDDGDFDLRKFADKFAELVAEQTHTNNKAQWYQEGYEAGQRDEREACAEVCEGYQFDYAKAIRARREK